MSENWEVAVIGGGASGMAAAVRSSELGKKTILLERGAMLGKKLSATGNGRCNLMNTGKQRYYGNAAFAQKVLSRCDLAKQKAFWHRYGVLLKEESQGRVYPVTMQASTVVDALKTGLRLNSAEVRLNMEIIAVTPISGTGWLLTGGDGSRFRAGSVIVAAGGAAAGKLGGTDAGYKLLEPLGYKLNPVFPALCAIKTDRRSISGLSGLRVFGTVAVSRKSLELHRETGEILFTDDGVSGICIMQCARFVQCEGADRLELNLVPPELAEGERLMEELRYRGGRFADESPSALLSGIVPKKLAYAVCKQAGLPMRGEQIRDLREEDYRRIADCMSHYDLQVAGTRGIEDAQVTAGGVGCEAFDPETMESRLHPGLYATGEILNVDGDCGGFNLMFAFGSGLIAGEHAGKKDGQERNEQ